MTGQMTGQQLESKLDYLKRDIDDFQGRISEVFEHMKEVENHPERGEEVRPAFFEDPNDFLLDYLKRLEQLKAQHAVIESEIEFRASLKQEITIKPEV
jgi:prefoldin subunit 5